MNMHDCVTNEAVGRMSKGATQGKQVKEFREYSSTKDIFMEIVSC